MPVPKNKAKIKRLADYQQAATGYTFDFGAIAFGDPLEQYKKKSEIREKVRVCMQKGRAKKKSR